MKEIVVIDCETSGLDPDTQEVIEVAVLVGPAWQDHELEMLAQIAGGSNVDPMSAFANFVPEPRLIWDSRVKPEHIETASPEALRVNGYTTEGWQDAIPANEAVVAVQRLVEDRIIVGQNVSFDLAFLRATARRAGLSFDYNRHVVDVMTLSWLVLMPMGLHTVSLGTVCWVLGISNEGAHSARTDVLRTWRAMHLLMRVDSNVRQLWRSRINELNRARQLVREAR